MFLFWVFVLLWSVHLLTLNRKPLCSKVAFSKKGGHARIARWNQSEIDSNKYITLCRTCFQTTSNVHSSHHASLCSVPLSDLCGQSSPGVPCCLPHQLHDGHSTGWLHAARLPAQERLSAHHQHREGLSDEREFKSVPRVRARARAWHWRLRPPNNLCTICVNA